MPDWTFKGETFHGCVLQSTLTGIYWCMLEDPITKNAYASNKSYTEGVCNAYFDGVDRWWDFCGNYDVSPTVSSPPSTNETTPPSSSSNTDEETTSGGNTSAIAVSLLTDETSLRASVFVSQSVLQSVYGMLGLDFLIIQDIILGRLNFSTIVYSHDTPGHRGVVTFESSALRLSDPQDFNIELALVAEDAQARTALVNLVKNLNASASKPGIHLKLIGEVHDVYSGKLNNLCVDFDVDRIIDASNIEGARRSLDSTYVPSFQTEVGSFEEKYVAWVQRQSLQTDDAKWLAAVVEKIIHSIEQLQKHEIIEINLVGGEDFGEKITIPCFLDDICDMEHLSQDTTVYAVMVRFTLRLLVLEDLADKELKHDPLVVRTPSLSISLFDDLTKMLDVDLLQVESKNSATFVVRIKVRMCGDFKHLATPTRSYIVSENT